MNHNILTTVAALAVLIQSLQALPTPEQAERNALRHTRLSGTPPIRLVTPPIRLVTPPVATYRTWDRSGVHVWNGRPYHWYGNSWVVVGGGGAESSFSEGTAGKVQQALNDRGYEAGPVDGVPGPKTRSAISAFQKDSGLPETGKIDEPLLGNLGLK